MASRRIDVHTHAMSQDVAMALAARGFKPTGGYKISVAWTPEAALAYMDRQEIAAQVVSMPMAFAGFDDDPEFGIRVCRMINEGNAVVRGVAENCWFCCALASDWRGRCWVVLAGRRTGDMAC